MVTHCDINVVELIQDFFEQMGLYRINHLNPSMDGQVLAAKVGENTLDIAEFEERTKTRCRPITQPIPFKNQEMAMDYIKFVAMTRALELQGIKTDVN